jgi:hypothetical protein
MMTNFPSINRDSVRNFESKSVDIMAFGIHLCCRRNAFLWPSKESFCRTVVVGYQIKSNVTRRSCGNLKCARFQAGDNHSRQSTAGHITRCENGGHRSNGCRFVGSRNFVCEFRTPSVSARHAELRGVRSACATNCV